MNDNSTLASQKNELKVELKPKLRGFLITYILFSLPSFVISTIVLVFAFIALIGLLFSGLGSVDSSMERLSYTTVQANSKTTDGILIYDLTGPILTGQSNVTDSVRISSIYTELVKKDFARIKNDSSIKNIVFRLNTPGGSIFASEVLGDQINDLIKYKGQSEAVFYYGQVVASGGLWATYKTQNYIIGSPYGETGSIGVYLTLPNYKGIADKIGYSETIIKSGPSKDIGNPFRDVSTDERAYLQSQVDKSYQEFVELVADSRKIEKSKVLEFANGYTYENPKALEMKLIDEIGSVDSAVLRASKNANLTQYNVYEVKTESSLSDLFVSRFLPELTSLKNATEKLGTNSLEPGILYAIDPYKL